MPLARRIAALLAGLGFLATALPASGQTPTPIKFTLDFKFQGIHAWYYVAKEKGYFKDERIDITIDQGEGSAATITRIMSGAYDAGFGDINAIIQQAANKPGEQPVMVYQIYNRPPFVIVTKANGLRITYALNNLMNAPEAVDIGVGDLKDDRLARSIDVIMEAYELKSKPKADDVFNRSFLPPLSERRISIKTN